MKRLLLLITISSLLASCSIFKPGSNSNSKSEDFDRFYKQFHTDSVFQMTRITFPLEGLPSFADESQFTSELFYWEESDWDIHKLINYDEFPQLSQKIVKENSLVKESVNMGNGFALERHFSLIDDKWFLVYYIGMNKLR